MLANFIFCDTIYKSLKDDRLEVQEESPGSIWRDSR